MQQTAIQEVATHTGSAMPPMPPSPLETSTLLVPQGAGGACGCQGASLSAAGGTYEPPPYVYALGRIETRFPSMDVEKEFSQAIARDHSGGQQTDRQTFHSVLARRENRYLARQLCWTLVIEGMDTYIVQPQDEMGFDALIEAIRPAPNPLDVDVVIGVKGPLAPPWMCNGLIVPVVVFDQIYSFDRNTLIKSIPRPASIPEKQDAAFRTSAEELFDRILQMADNAGATPEHRALNYLAMRYPVIYAKAAEYHGLNYSLTAVEVRPSRLSGTARAIVDVSFAFTHRQTDFTEQCFVRVDVTGKFPYLVTKLSPYYHR